MTLLHDKPIIPVLLDRRDLVIRHLLILALSVFFGSLHATNEGVALFSTEVLRAICSCFIYIAMIWNGNIFIVELIDRYLRWDTQLRMKLMISIAVAIAWPVIVHIVFHVYIFGIINGFYCPLASADSILNLVIAVSITLLVNSIFFALAFFRFWKRTLLEKEELKRDSLSAEFETLKSQINPHFLFNSLNTLTSLIEENPATATDFVQKLSSVYRYVLSQKDKEVVPLGDEIEFIRSYIFLNRIRFGENLRAVIDVPAEARDRRIATLSLQMLVENAIKHNVISAQKPLTITVKAERDHVIVENNLQRKQSVESNGIGLNNIIHRYGFLSEREVEITEGSGHFTVKLPLI